MKRHDLFYTILGGAGLLVATGIVQMFFSTPPSRAEFSELKQTVHHINDKLSELKKGQGKILDHLIKKRR